MVFAGAGLDATPKQLIRDTLPVLLEVNDEAAAHANRQPSCGVHRSE